MKKFILFMIYILALGCGVRGDPLPPVTPAELGRGRPNYKRATEDIKLNEPEFNETEDDGEEESEEEEF